MVAMLSRILNLWKKVYLVLVPFKEFICFEPVIDFS